ncbi:MAG: hypothetical protein ACFFCS_14855 [Candidatus Hodarchaeota archaeon]
MDHYLVITNYMNFPKGGIADFAKIAAKVDTEMAGDLAKLAEYGEIIINKIATMTADGGKGLAIVKIKEGHLEKAFDLAAKYHGRTAMGAPGYTFIIEIFYGPEATGELTGIKFGEMYEKAK